MEQLMAKLKKAGIVTSTRGAKGGYVLAKTEEEITIGDVLRALEGSLEPIDCPGIAGEAGCSGSDTCITKYVWKRINEGVNQIVDDITLRSVIEESGQG